MPSPPRADSRSDPYLIAAVSARPLADSARRGAHAAAVLDLFADADTQGLGYPCRNVARADALRFDTTRLLAAADELAPPEACAGVVCGSGFESAPELLARLARGRRLLGNLPGTVAAIKDPGRFFGLLDTLGLPHPETRLDPPANASGWLAKRRGGAGGTHVCPAARARADRDTYFQRIQPGRSLSALFLADGRRALVLGFNEQWTAGGSQPFLYGGGMGSVILAPALDADIAAAVQRITEATGLVGLNGLDFIAGDPGWGVIEVNPRPTASLEYYDEDWPGGLFAAHVRACDGELPDAPPAPTQVRGHAVIYAGWPLHIGSDMRFPAWCRDIPNPGTAIPAGGPICTVHGSATSGQEVSRLIRQRCAEIESVFIKQAA
jgi:uncharacterized protein